MLRRCAAASRRRSLQHPFFSAAQSSPVPFPSPQCQDTEPGKLAAAYQNFFICVEMFFISVAHLYAFPYQPYINPDDEEMGMQLTAFQRVSSNLKKVGSGGRVERARGSDKRAVRQASGQTSERSDNRAVRQASERASGREALSWGRGAIDSPPPILSQTLNPRDIVDDTVRNFSSKYNNYHQQVRRWKPCPRQLRL